MQHVLAAGTYRYCILLVFLCFCRLSSNGQQAAIDSLHNVIRTAKHDTLVAAAYVGLTEIYFNTHLDSVIPLCNKALEIADKNLPGAEKAERRAFLLSKADALNNIAVTWQVQGKMNEALGHLGQVLALYDQAGTPERKPITYNNIGVIYYKQGQTEKALDAYHKSLKVREQLNDQAGVAQSLSNIGAIYFNQRQLDKALDYFLRSVAIRRKTDDNVGLAFSLNNVGAVYRELGETEKARTYYDEALSIYTALDNKEGIANTLNNTGTLYGNSDPAKALEYFRRSLALYEAEGNMQGVANASNSIALALVKTGKAAEAVPFADRALEQAQKGGYTQSIRNAYLVLFTVDSALGNNAAALANYKQYIFYRDSIANEATRKAGAEKFLQYEYEKREAVLKSQQEEERKRQELINWIIGVSVGVLLLFLLAVFNRFRLRQKHRHQQQLNAQQKAQAIAVMETQEQERKRIAEDLHDSLGHLLSTVKFNLQALPESQKAFTENPLQLLNQASHEIRNITFNLMPRTLEEEGLVPALNELATKTAMAGVPMQLQVHGLERLPLEKQAQFTIYRIIQEAVNNILKHAQAGEISIQLIRQNGHLAVMIEDDGKGFDTATVKKNGRGLKNITTRAAWLNATTSIDSMPGRGTTIAIEIPVTA